MVKFVVPSIGSTINVNSLLQLSIIFGCAHEAFFVFSSVIILKSYCFKIPDINNSFTLKSRSVTISHSHFSIILFVFKIFFNALSKSDFVSSLQAKTSSHELITIS